MVKVGGVYMAGKVSLYISNKVVEIERGHIPFKWEKLADGIVAIEVYVVEDDRKDYIASIREGFVHDVESFEFNETSDGSVKWIEAYIKPF